MFELRRLYTTIIFWGILLSQIVPTFGAYLGFAGNWIPYTTGFAVTSLGVLLYLFEERAVQDRITKYSFFLYWVVAVVHTVSLMLIFSDLSLLSEYADLFRWITIPVFLLSGVAYARKKDRPLRGGYVLNLILLVFTVLLFADFIRDQWSGIQKLYATHTHGFGRYAGNWNYPYNLSVGLAFYMIVLSLGWQEMRSLTASFFSALGVFVCILLIAVGQSRGSLAALFGTTVIFFAYWLFRLDVVKRFRANGRILVPVSAIGTLVVAVFASFDVSVLDLVQRFGKRYLEFTSAAATLESAGRGEEISQMTQYLSAYPINLIVGFGPLRDVEFWVQNLLLYILRYGVVGLILYVFFIPGMTVIDVYFNSRSRLLRSITLGYVTWIIFVLLNSVSHDIFSHFRFIPLFYFVTGVILGCRHRNDI